MHYEFGTTKRIMKMKMSLRNLGDTRLRGRKIQNQKSTVNCSPEEPGGIYLSVCEQWRSISCSVFGCDISSLYSKGFFSELS